MCRGGNPLMIKAPPQPLQSSGPEDERITEHYLWRRKATGPATRRSLHRGLDRAPDFAPPARSSADTRRRVIAGGIIAAALAAALLLLRN